MTIHSSIESALLIARTALQHTPSGLFTDVDGTISPIVVDPSDARVPESVRTALRRLRDRVDSVGVISGRAAVDARRMVRVGGISYLGNHGMEHLVGRRSIVDPEIARFLEALNDCAEGLHALENQDGIVLENKRLSLTVHYRTAPDPAAARRFIHQNIRDCARCDGLRVEDGRKVVNVLPPVTVNKGTAIAGIAEQRELRGVVYLGDDVTDVDAFIALRELRARGVRTAAIAVGSSESPAALLANADAVIDGVASAVVLIKQLSSE